MTEDAKKTDRIPRHIAVIMDGNGRWARQHNIPRIEGHRAGSEAVRRVVEACSDLGVEYLTLYAFSSENWKRPPAEVRYLMDLLSEFLDQYREDFDKHEIRLNVIGDLSKIPAIVRRKIREVVKHTRNYNRGVLTLALSYGARNEIVTAAQQIAGDVVAGAIKSESIDEDLFAKYLYTADMPDPDLLIRTSGELRLSNFLLWQVSYTELWFTSTLWPDFGKEDIQEAINSYQSRIRRFGGRTDNV